VIVTVPVGANPVTPAALTMSPTVVPNAGVVEGLIRAERDAVPLLTENASQLLVDDM